ncbi:MAG: histidinol-phosphate transaminase, partial [Caulobacterales bacterium]|nr:histidinol-phosphate transaminase [Caulobacterales bacterium]
FNVNAPAQAAGVAALKDEAFLARSCAHNDSELAYVSGVAEQLGLLAAPSVANFVLLRFPAERGRTAAQADAFLRSRGFILRRVASSGLPDCLRMTLGTAEVNRAVMGALSEFVNG